MDNISKMQNEKCEFNSCSINDINSFIAKKYYFKSFINLSQNPTRKHCNIILSYRRHTQYFLNSKKLARKVKK